MKLNFNRIACLSMLLIVVALAVLIQTAQSLLDASVSVDKTAFNPTAGQTVTISYTNGVSMDSSSLRVNDANGANWVNTPCTSAQGTYTYIWDGKYAGDAVPDGTYYIIYNVRKGVESNPASTTVTVYSGTLPTSTPAPTITPTPTPAPTPTPTPIPKPDLAGKIVFTSNRDDNNNYEIYVMNADGSGVTRLTNNPAGDSHPVWSPDGSKIAFASDRDGNWEIYVMNADGSGQARLTNNLALDNSPAWSPDGSKIVFMSNRDGNYNYEIYVMNADGSGQARLTNNPEDDNYPAWSPDGSKIVFASDRNGYGFFVMNADGSGVTRLTNRGTDYDPAWSPDGSKIAFWDGGLNIYVMNADGSGVTELTKGADEMVPAWSPDGSKIVFTSDRDGNSNYEIYVMNADGSGVTRLTNNPANDQSGDWTSVQAPIPTSTPTSMPTPTPTSIPTPSPTPDPVPGNDTAPPVTVVAFNGAQGNGADLYTSDVQVVLVANDGAGSGVNWTQYSLDNASWHLYTAPFTISGEGLNTVYYYSADKADNIEAIQAKTFAISKQTQIKIPCCLNALVLPLLCVGVLSIGMIRRRKDRR